MNILNSNIEQRCPDYPEVHLKGMQIHACMTPPALKIWENGC